MELIRKLFFYILFFWGFLIVESGYSQVGIEDTVKILTIGNSFADNATRYLEEITTSVPGKHIQIGKANLGGAPLDRHTDFIHQSKLDPTFKPYSGRSLQEWLELDQWDFVTIQQVSHKSFKAETYHPYVDELIRFIQCHALDAEILIH